jgi:hypothetical protein
MTEFRVFVSMSGLLLADTDAIQFIVYGVILLVTVLGGLLQKKKEEQKSSPPATPRAPAPPQRPPVRARPPVQRPQPVPPPWDEPRALPTRTPRSAEPARTQPTQTVPRRTARPAATPAPQPGVMPAIAAQEPTTTAFREQELVRPASVKRPRRTTAYTAAQLQSLLDKPQGVQTAMVLSEILGPPVALRE